MDQVTWDDVDELEALETQAAIAKHMPLEQLLGITAQQDKRAAYVVEVMMKPKVGKTTLFFGHIQLCVGGNGRGDGLQSLHLCGKCEGPVPSLFLTAQRYVCPRCQFSDKADNISEGAFFRLGIDKLSKLVAKYYRKVDCDADIIVRRFPVSAHKVAEAVKLRDNKFVELSRRDAKEKTTRAVYTRDRIMRDNLVSGDLERRIKAFLQAG